MPEDPKKRFWERDTWSDSGAECALKEAIAAAWATAFAKTGDKNLADDGSQEAALEVLAKKSPSDFNGAIHLVRYMCRCAFCRAISQLRKDQRCCRYGDAVDQIVDDRLDHTLLAEWREAGERARAAIAALPPTGGAFSRRSCGAGRARRSPRTWGCPRRPYRAGWRKSSTSCATTPTGRGGISACLRPPSPISSTETAAASRQRAVTSVSRAAR